MSNHLQIPKFIFVDNELFDRLNNVKNLEKKQDNKKSLVKKGKIPKREGIKNA